MRAQFITAEEVQQVLDVSRSKSYQIIRDLNKELKSMGYHTIAGKCPILQTSMYHLFTVVPNGFEVNQPAEVAL